MRAWLYKWLPIFFGCHCRPDRSFFYRGKQFPICARCTGELAGIFASVIGTFFFLPPVWVCLLLMLPLIADGFLQLSTPYESTNFRRVTTGFLFGYALFALLAISTAAAFLFGYSLTS